MFASLLPGLRQLRAPLAAGYIWLVFAYFVAGAPTAVGDAPGPLQELLTILPTMGKAATAIAVSFVAYLIGSLSEDLFDQVLPRGLQRASTLLPRHLDPRDRRILDRVEHMVDETRALESLQSQLASIDEDVRRRGAANEDQAALDAMRDQSFELRRDGRQLLGVLRDELDALIPMLDELRAAGASEGEKPEALRPMVEAEEKLRTAIVPPLVAVMTYLTATASLVWGIGVIFAIALFAQAVTRRVEAGRLADQYYRALSVEDTEAALKEIATSLQRGEDVDARQLRLTLRRLSHRLAARDSVQPA